MAELKFLELHGDRIAYRDEGDGEALLLIHGMARSSETWRAVLPRLAKNHRVVAPDLLGHGLSAKPRGDYSLGAFAVWLRDFLDEVGIAQATVVGHSLGGGFVLGRPPSAITLREVVEAVEGPIIPNRCLMGSGACDRAGECNVHSVWRLVQGSVVEVLDGVLVRVSRTTQLSRAAASKLTIMGGAMVRFQNVYKLRR